jgi:hypothetical protein
MVYDDYDYVPYVPNGFQKIGLRFQDVNIPYGSVIQSSYIQFRSDETNSDPAELLIYAENSSDAAPFDEEAPYTVSARPTFSDSVYWSPPAWTSTGQTGPEQRTSDIGNLLQLVINNNDWMPGNNIVFKIVGTGVSLIDEDAVRVADSYEGKPTHPPTLVYEYSFDASSFFINFTTSIKVFLEGAFSENEMSTTLNESGALPLAQPYFAEPWNYPGDEQVAAIPNDNIVDWVLVELRDAPTPETAVADSRIVRKAGFLLKDGTIVDIDGTSNLLFENIYLKNNLFIAIYHRNHLSILSAFPAEKQGDNYNYDFTTALTQAFNAGAGYKELGNTIYGMVGGDATADGVINNNDYTNWETNAGTEGYSNADFNLDMQTDNKDKNEILFFNGVFTSQVPE